MLLVLYNSAFLNESAVLNESFDMNDSVNHILKQGLAATYWWVYCHAYLSMTDLNQPAQKHIQQNCIFLLSILTKIPGPRLEKAYKYDYE